MDLQGASDRVRCRPDVRAKGDFKRVASLAQQESQSMSQNIRLGIQYRFQQGKMQVNFGKFMGYTRGEDGQAVIVP